MESLYLEVPTAPRIQRAGSFAQMWSSLSNDEVYEATGLYEKTFGTVYGKDDPADLERLQMLVAALVTVVDAVNCQLDVLLARYSPGANEPSNWRAVLEFMSNARQSAAPMLAHAMGHLEEELSRAQRAHAVGRTDYRGSLVKLHFLPMPREYRSGETFDVFVSYKRAKYSRDAASLCEALAKEGLRCWLDREQIRLRAGELLEKGELQAMLKGALQACRTTVFFETYAEAIADGDERGGHVAYNWQMFEHRHANRLIYVRPQSGVIDFPGSRSSQSFSNERELVQRVATFTRDQADVAPLRRIRSGGSHSALAAAVEVLRRGIHEYFGHAVAVSARLARIVLAPELADEHGTPVMAMGDAVLINLLRCSPYAALALQRSGISVAKLLLVGGEVDELWSPPSDLRASDLFGEYVLPQSGTGLLTRAGLLDERALLHGIFRFGAEIATGSFPGRLLLRTLGFMGIGHTKADREQYLRLAFERFENETAGAFIPEPGQQWLVSRHGGSVCARPLGECGMYQLANSPYCADRPFVVYKVLPAGLFESDALTELESSLNSGAAAEGIEAVLTRYPVLELALSDIETHREVVCFWPWATQETDGGILYVVPPAETLSEQEPLPTGTARQIIAARLAQAVSSLAGGAQIEQTLPGQSGRRALLLGPLKSQRIGAAVPISGEFDFHCQVLTPLWHVSALDRLNYDLT